MDVFKDALGHEGWEDHEQRLMDLLHQCQRVYELRQQRNSTMAHPFSSRNSQAIHSLHFNLLDKAVAMSKFDGMRDIARAAVLHVRASHKPSNNYLSQDLKPLTLFGL